MENKKIQELDNFFNNMEALSFVGGVLKSSLNIIYYKALIDDVHEQILNKLGIDECHARDHNKEECFNNVLEKRISIIEEIKKEKSCKECGLIPSLNFSSTKDINNILGLDIRKLKKELPIRIAYSFIMKFEDIYNKKNTETDPKKWSSKCMEYIHKDMKIYGVCICNSESEEDMFKCFKEYSLSMTDILIKVVEEHQKMDKE